MITFDDVQAAAGRLGGIAHRTPCLQSRTLNGFLNADVFLKAESFQRAGAFKFRGAFNKLSTLAPAELEQGVIALSSGNHAQAVALASRIVGTRAVILMPHDAPATKLEATRAYGAEVALFDRYSEDFDELLEREADARGLVAVHPFDDPVVMAGQGTVASELIEQAGSLDLLVVCVGGGGLIAGCATAAKALIPEVRVVGVEPEAGNDVQLSLRAGQRVEIDVPRTIADGQQLTVPGRRTFEVIRTMVDDVVTATDGEIVTALVFLLERLKVVVEPSGACALAALLAGRLDVSGLRVGVTISGGNIGAERFRDLLSSYPQEVQLARRLVADPVLHVNDPEYAG